MCCTIASFSMSWGRRGRPAETRAVLVRRAQVSAQQHGSEGPMHWCCQKQDGGWGAAVVSACTQTCTSRCMVSDSPSAALQLSTLCQIGCDGSCSPAEFGDAPKNVPHSKVLHH
jgi:hypothetical protein